ncbi:NAD(P)-binding protein, partial [Macroventuria anomochaeta]
MPKSMFITGGSGYIGSCLIAHAIASSYTVTALSRTPTSDTKLSALGATPVRGSLSSHAILTAQASKADIVVSIADSITGDYSISKEERFRINDAANDALAEGLRGTGKALVLTSGSLIAAADEGRETDESSSNKKYVGMGVRACHILLAPYVYGRGGSGVGLFMGMWKRAGSGMKVDGGEKYTTVVHVDDAVRLYLLVAERGGAGEAYNATAQNNITQGQLAEAICKAIDVPCKLLRYREAVPKVGEFLASFLSVENRASNRKAREELGWEIKEKGILEDIETGSYVEVAEALKDG